MSEDAGRDVERQDDILELLYWLEGEGLTANTTLAGMSRFLAQDEQATAETLDRLATREYVVADGIEFRLTATGRREAARRFADEFSSMLAQGHGECNDPTCDCHTNPAGAAECHAARAQGGHEH